MVNLQEKQDWKALRDAAERAIKETPDWYTPYVYAGIAYANLGQKEKAIQLIQFADKGMDGNPDYNELPAETKKLLDLLRPR